MYYISCWFVNICFHARGIDEAYRRLPYHFKVLSVLLTALVADYLTCWKVRHWTIPQGF